MPIDTTTPRPRRSPFIRPEVLPPFKLQRRDVAILRAVARLHLIDTAQMYRYIKIVCAPPPEPRDQRLKPKDPSGHSEVHLRRRLRLLVAHGFLQLPEAQRYLSAYSFKADGGSIPLVFSLGAEGAREVSRYEHHLDPRTAWSRKAKDVSPFTIAHSLEVSEFVISMLEAANGHDLTLRDHYDLLPEFPASRPAYHTSVFQLTATLPDTYRSILDPKDTRTDALVVHTKPDRVFSLISADGTQRTNFLYEADRETETVRPSALSNQATIRRKILGYWHAFKNNVHTTQWGFANARVLFQTHSQSHIDVMVKALKAEIPSGTGLFLFSTRELIATHGPLAPVWTQYARGETSTVSLVRAAEPAILASSTPPIPTP